MASVQLSCENISIKSKLRKKRKC